MALAHLADRLVVAALAVEVDRDDGAHARSRSVSLRDRAVEQLGVHRPGRLVAVDEERCRARVRDRVGARRERQVRAGDLVAGADPEDDERQVKRGRAARERDRIGDAGDGRELALEGVDVRPERSDPVRLDRFRDQLCLAAGEVGWGQVDTRHRAPSVPAAQELAPTAILPAWQGTG